MNQGELASTGDANPGTYGVPDAPGAYQEAPPRTTGVTVSLGDGASDAAVSNALLECAERWKATRDRHALRERLRALASLLE